MAYQPKKGIELAHGMRLSQGQIFVPVGDATLSGRKARQAVPSYGSVPPQQNKNAPAPIMKTGGPAITRDTPAPGANKARE
jgi:hypothetical protein